MTYRTHDQFKAELDGVRKKLQEAGHEVANVFSGDTQGIQCDFELPYSTLPKLGERQWSTPVSPR